MLNHSCRGEVSCWNSMGNPHALQRAKILRPAIRDLDYTATRLASDYHTLPILASSVHLTLDAIGEGAHYYSVPYNSRKGFFSKDHLYAFPQYMTTTFNHSTSFSNPSRNSKSCSYVMPVRAIRLSYACLCSKTSRPRRKRRSFS